MSRRIVTGLLRGEMGFTGLVTSDCMEMQAVQKFFGSINGVLAAMNAGVDPVSYTHLPLPEGFAKEELTLTDEALNLSLIHILGCI